LEVNILDLRACNSNLRIIFSASDAPVVTIASFAPQLVVITSKQRPRKLTIHGSDGKDYAFLLKGHEDLRQDERVMQVSLSLSRPLLIHTTTHTHTLFALFTVEKSDNNYCKGLLNPVCWKMHVTLAS
jgi:hypothetical protein